MEDIPIVNMMSVDMMNKVESIYKISKQQRCLLEIWYTEPSNVILIRIHKVVNNTISNRKYPIHENMAEIMVALCKPSLQNIVISIWPINTNKPMVMLNQNKIKM